MSRVSVWIGAGVVLCVACAAPAAANDSSMALIGGVPHVLEAPDVSMDGEVLVFEHVPFAVAAPVNGACPDGFAAGYDGCYRDAHHAADLRYTFTNHGDAQTLQIGLPFDVPTFDEGDVVGPEGSDPIVGLRTWVDGEEVEVTRVDADVQGVPWDANRSYVVTVPFEPGQTRVLRHTFRAHSGGSFASGWFDYILRSGTGWRGPIGSIDIRFALPEASPCVTASLPFTREGTDVRVQLTDVEPDTDFAIQWIRPSDVLAMLGVFADVETAAERCTDAAFADRSASELRALARRVELFYGAPHGPDDAALVAEGLRPICGQADMYAWAWHTTDDELAELSPAQQRFITQVRALEFVPTDGWESDVPEGVAMCVAAMRAAAASQPSSDGDGPASDESQ